LSIIHDSGLKDAAKIAVKVRIWSNEKIWTRVIGKSESKVIGIKLPSSQAFWKTKELLSLDSIRVDVLHAESRDFTYIPLNAILDEAERAAGQYDRSMGNSGFNTCLRSK
jgi:hypothetical protein